MPEARKWTSQFDSQEINEVREEEAARFSACAMARERGVRCTVGGIPADYPDRLIGIRQRDLMRVLAEET